MFFFSFFFIDRSTRTTKLTLWSFKILGLQIIHRLTAEVQIREYIGKDRNLQRARKRRTSRLKYIYAL